MPVLGVVPYYTDIHVPEEDSPAIGTTVRSEEALIDVAVVALPHISNFDEFDPIGRDPGVSLRYVRSITQLGKPDLVIVPGDQDDRRRHAAPVGRRYRG